MDNNLGDLKNANFKVEEYDWPGFLAHEHYVWHSTRPRTKQGTVELRAACQQPWSEHMAATALQLGLVEAMPEIQASLFKLDFIGSTNTIRTNSVGIQISVYVCSGVKTRVHVLTWNMELCVW